MSNETDNAKRLREVMTEYRLSRADVAQLMERPKVTIDSWLCPPSAALYRKMPDSMRLLLDLLVKDRRRELDKLRRTKEQSVA